LEFNLGDFAIGIHPQTQRLCGLWGFCRGDYLRAVRAFGCDVVTGRAG
jgi:hypothetical protein